MFAEVLDTSCLIPTTSSHAYPGIMRVYLFSKEWLLRHGVSCPPPGFWLIKTVHVTILYLCLLFLFSDPKLAGQGWVLLP